MSPTLLGCLTLLTFCNGNALLKFVRRRKIYNASTTVLTDDQSPTGNVWIEHTYQLLNGPIIEKITNADRVLKIAVQTHEDYAFDFPSENNRSEGYTAELLGAIASFADFRLDFVDFDNASNASDLFGGDDVDIVINHAGFVEKLPGNFQFIPTLQCRFALVYKPSNINFTKDIFVITFAGTLWLAFLAMLIAAACCLRVTTNYYYAIHPTRDRWTWLEITLWAIAAACQQGLSYAPHKFGSCLIFLLGYVAAYLLYTGFTAGITSTLLQDHATELKLEDLNLKVVGLDYVTYPNERALKISLKASNMPELFSQIGNKNTVGVAPKILIEQYLAKFNAEVDTYATTDLPWVYRRGVIIKSDNRWRRDLFKWLIKLQELGILQNAFERNSLHLRAHHNTIYSNAGIEHVGSAILLLLGGALLAIVFMTFEFIVAYYTNHNVK